MSATAIPAAEVQAALDRAVGLMLIQAIFNNEGAFEQARHEARALRWVRDGRWAWSATRPYHVAPMLKAAWTALPVGIEDMPMSQVQQFLSSHGVQVTPNNVADLQIDAVEQLEDAQDPGLVLNQEQALPLGDGPHGASDVVASHGGAL